MLADRLNEGIVGKRVADLRSGRRSQIGNGRVPDVLALDHDRAARFQPGSVESTTLCHSPEFVDAVLY